VLDKKLVLYARKDCTEQLGKIHGVSITEVTATDQNPLVYQYLSAPNVFADAGRLAGDPWRAGIAKMHVPLDYDCHSVWLIAELLERALRRTHKPLDAHRKLPPAMPAPISSIHGIQSIRNTPVTVIISPIYPILVLIVVTGFRLLAATTRWCPRWSLARSTD
jgi:hypothetical protein